MSIIGKVGRRLVGWLGTVVWLCLPGLLSGADTLAWRSSRNSVDADIKSWELPKLLEEIATVTGWQVWVEPGAHHTVSTKFKERPADKALELLLGDLSYVRLPQTSGPPKLIVFRTSQKEAIQLIPPRDEKAAKAAKPIPNELIVTFNSGASIDELAKKLGAKVAGRSAGRNAARLQFESAEAANAAREKLLQDDSVGAIDPNFPILSQPGLDASGGAALPNLKLAPIKEGEGIIVGLVDSPVQRQGNPLDSFLLQSISVSGDGTAPPEDHPTHGTAMWETILRGISSSQDSPGGSRVRVLPVDVYGNSPSTTTFEVAEGILRAMKAGASIINLSLGSEGDTPYLHDIITEGQKAGRVFVASAGNEPVKTPTYPAAYPEVIAVTAGDGQGGIAPYANSGDFVDIVAPGTSMVSFNGQTWRVSGTSPAAARVVGLIAGTADAKGTTPEQAATAVRKNLPPVLPQPR
jgi:ribosomal protein L18